MNKAKKTLIKHWKKYNQPIIKVEFVSIRIRSKFNRSTNSSRSRLLIEVSFSPRSIFLCLCPRGLPGSKWHQSQLQSIFHTNFNMLQLKRTLAFRKSYTIQSKNILCRCRHQLLICKKLKKISYKSVKMYSTQTHRKF
jgi:hypothetical protein